MPARSAPPPARVVRRASLPGLVRPTAECFAAPGDEAYLVGGLVRDVLLGRTTGDIDIAVGASVADAGPALAAALGGTFVVLDAKRDIGRVVVLADGRAQHVDLTPLGGSIRENLARRDFTLDAMAVPLGQAASGVDAEVVDPFGGVADLEAGVVRAVSDGVFKDDPCRLLRAPRLAAQLDMRLDAHTVGLAKRDARLVRKVAPERVRDELLKLLATPRATQALRLLDDLGLLCEIMPEFLDAKGVGQPPEHHWDVFQHCVETPGQVDRVLSGPGAGRDEVVWAVPRFEGMQGHFGEVVSDGHTRRTVLKLAALLHDVGKPAAKTVEPSGRIRFLGHHDVGAAAANGMLKRLRLSRRGVELVSVMVEHHLRPSQMAQVGEMPTRRAVYRYFRDVGDAAVDTLYLNMADYLAARGPSLELRDWQRHCGVIEHVLKTGLVARSEEREHKLLDGHTVMTAFGLPPGPHVGTLLEMVHEAQAAGEVTTTEEAMELVKATLASGEPRA
ncbi:MAG: HD domain-containing protein [SAR202 cluster bacterium]|nr:HD domain-containing protein [SAR202 cluster bacterium]